MNQKKLLYSVILTFIQLVTNYTFAQYEVIPTGTTIDIDEIEKFGDNVVIMGNTQFLVKCSGDCLNLQSILPAGMEIPFGNRSLIVTDTNKYYFLNMNSMLPSMYSKLYTTSDGGQSWNVHVLPNFFVTSNLLVFDSSYYLALDDNQGIYTLDGGMNWLQGTTLPFVTVASSFCINDSTAVVGGFQKIAYTTNRGVNWTTDEYIQASPLNYASTDLDSLYFVSNSAVNGTLSFIFNPDLSNRIDRVIPKTLPIGIYVVSQNEIYVTGKDYTTNKGRILKTTDLGVTWIHFDIQENNYLADLVPLNDSIFLIGGQGGLLIKWNKNSPMQTITLGLTESDVNLEVEIFPNPANNKQQIEINNPHNELVEVSVFDAQGRNLGLYYSESEPINPNIIIVDLSRLPKGTFFYQLKIGNRQIHKPFHKL